MTTLTEFGQDKLSRLCNGLGLTQILGPATEVFQMMSESWRSFPRADASPWKNDITDDGTPFEFSVAFGQKGPTLRMLFETQKPPFSTMSAWEAGCEFNQKIPTLGGVGLARFEQIKDLFSPSPDLQVPYSLWHAVNFDVVGRPSFKIYLNPQVRGKQAALSLLQEAFVRLDMNGVWDFISSRMGADSKVIFFSLDLADSQNARVKIYTAHANATTEQIESQCTDCRDYVPGDAERWISTLLKSSGPFTRRPLLTCFSVTSPKQAPRVTVHLPIRSYVANDKQALERLKELLSERNFGYLENGVRQMANRPLEVGRGLMTYVSARRELADENITFYLSPEAYSILAPR